MPFLLFSAGRDFGGAEEKEPRQKLLLQDEVPQTAAGSVPPHLAPLCQTQLCDPAPLHRWRVTLCQAHHQPPASHHLLYLQRPAPPRQREQEEQGPGEGAGPDGASGEDPQAQAGGCGEPQRACRQDS